MSLVSISGGATGSGTFTVLAPSTNTNRTLTLPDNSGTMLNENSNIEAQVKTATNATGTAPIYAARAWVNFNGQGAVAIRASGNVSSITDNGVGKYTVNMITALSDANYAYSLSCVAPDTSGVNTGIMLEGSNTTVTNKTASQMSIVIGLQTSNTYIDKVDVSAIIFR